MADGEEKIPIIDELEQCWQEGSYASLHKALVFSNQFDEALPGWLSDVFFDMIAASRRGEVFSHPTVPPLSKSAIKQMELHNERYKMVVQVAALIKVFGKKKDGEGRDDEKNIEAACAWLAELSEAAPYDGGEESFKKSYYKVRKMLRNNPTRTELDYLWRPVYLCT